MRLAVGDDGMVSIQKGGSWSVEGVSILQHKNPEKKPDQKMASGLEDQLPIPAYPTGGSNDSGGGRCEYVRITNTRDPETNSFHRPENMLIAIPKGHFGLFSSHHQFAKARC